MCQIFIPFIEQSSHKEEGRAINHCRRRWFDKHIHTFSLMSMSQESMLSLKRSSVLPLLLLRLLLCSSCLLKHTHTHTMKEPSAKKSKWGPAASSVCGWERETDGAEWNKTPAHMLRVLNIKLYLLICKCFSWRKVLRQTGGWRQPAEDPWETQLNFY